MICANETAKTVNFILPNISTNFFKKIIIRSLTKIVSFLYKFKTYSLQII